MRIVYLTHQYLPRHIGGTELYTRALATRARTAGHRVAIVTYHELESPDRTAFGVRHRTVGEIPVSEVHYALGATPNPARFEYENGEIGNWIRSELERLQPDLVHAVHTMKLSVSALSVCVEMRIPVVMTLCDYWAICPRTTLLKWDGSLCLGPRHWTACLKCCQDLHGFADVDWVRRTPDGVLPWLAAIKLWRARNRQSRLGKDLLAIRDRNRTVRRVLLQARRIIALTPFQKRLFVRNGFPAHRVEVLRHGLETSHLVSHRNRPPGTTERLTILYLGSIVEHKGLHVLLEALLRVPDLPVACLVYGDLSARTSYTKRIQEFAKRDRRVELRGTYHPRDEGRVFAQADLLVLPALWYENGPLVVKAAHYLGIPVLASDIGSLAEMIRPGENGWLVPRGDAAALARELQRLSTCERPLSVEPQAIKTMDENANEMFRIYQQVVKGD